jgi:NAD(P)-dependent dehydrogenase (short-subunit alcohol dehydrogenase family)
MSKRLDGRVSAVTGAGSGIGAAIARRMAAEGAYVWVIDMNATGAAETASLIRGANGQSEPRAVDVSDEAAVKETIDAIVAANGKLDILVNAAGVSMIDDTRIVDIPSSTWDRVIAVNLRGPFLTCKYTIPVLVANGGGVIINISSQAGFGGGTAYASSKAALNALTRGVSRQHANDGIRCVTIAPGAIETPMLEVSKQKLGDQIVAPRPGVVRPVGSADEVAGLAAFLASDEASYISGAIYTIDGGASGY